MCQNNVQKWKRKYDAWAVALKEVSGKANVAILPYDLL